MRRIVMIVAIAVCAATAVASFAFAASGAGKHQDNAILTRVYSDCLHSPSGTLRHTYTAATLNRALNHLPADVAEYSNCSDAIRVALRPSPGTQPAITSSWRRVFLTFSHSRPRPPGR